MSSDTRVIYDGHIVRLEVLDGKWEVVRHDDAVAVLALNEHGEMLLVRQQRRAVGRVTLEAPAGLIDGGETPEAAARRELQEEAGLDGDMTLLTHFYSSPGFCDEALHVFEATNLRPSKLPHDEDEEGLEVVWQPPAQVLAGLRDGSVAGSASTVTAALFALQRLAERA
ncbi:NUDIX domain-containing protein [Deinococcus sp. HMF7620]|uniref:NUDIX domain-containing protein n=1 Tax=Deinococcus arboris TaxID=2682977 RepID=A0A7C9M7F2_9DEIO|nr:MULTISPECIES: NUDIX hydrolase [Deinococcus]MBZ9753380.1 NUDIX hydrolase [Deinococcus betulae]MVN87845.1 NUDIX domain-containing protein [Deinococcus arboris]